MPKSRFPAGLPCNYHRGLGGRWRMTIFSKWLTMKDLMNRWNTSIRTIYDAIKYGLTCYTPDESEDLQRCDYSSLPRLNKSIQSRPRSRTGGWIQNWEIVPTGLPQRVHVSTRKRIRTPNLYFRECDVIEFEETHFPSDELTSSERRRYGQLLSERERIEDAIKATVIAYRHLRTPKQPIIYSDFHKLIGEKFPDLPNTLIRKIWKAMPKKNRKASGRPTRMTQKK